MSVSLSWLLRCVSNVLRALHSLKKRKTTPLLCGWTSKAAASLHGLARPNFACDSFSLRHSLSLAFPHLPISAAITRQPGEKPRSQVSHFLASAHRASQITGYFPIYRTDRTGSTPHCRPITSPYRYDPVLAALANSFMQRAVSIPIPYTSPVAG